MSNYPLSPTTKQNIHGQVNNLMSRRVALMAQNFPLSHLEVYAAVVPEHLRATFIMLKTHNVNSVNTARQFFGVVDFEYPILVSFSLPKSEIYAWNEQTGVSSHYLVGSLHQGRPYAQMPFDCATLDPAQLEKFTAWVLKVGQEQRLKQLTREIVASFLNDHCHTMYHLLARWPDLRLILAKLKEGDWSSRIDAAPPSYKLRRWNWTLAEEEWVDKYRNAMQLIAEVLVSGAMLPNDIKPTSPVVAMVYGWVKNSKWVFPS